MYAWPGKSQDGEQVSGWGAGAAAKVTHDAGCICQQGRQWPLKPVSLPEEGLSSQGPRPPVGAFQSLGAEGVITYPQLGQSQGQGYLCPSAVPPWSLIQQLWPQAGQLCRGLCLLLWEESVVLQRAGVCVQS